MPQRAMTSPSTQGPLAVLGRWAADLLPSDIPEHVAHRARLALRDTVGTKAAGATTRAGRLAAQAAAATPGAVLEAFAAAVAASALDLDDGHYRGGAIHPSSVIVPALLTAAASLDRATSAPEFTRAQVVGYEIGLRAAHLLWPRHEADDYHCTGTAGALGAASAVTALRGDDADVIARSIAIAWAHAPMSTFQLPMVKESIGWSAATGLFAADLALVGFMHAPGRAPTAIDATFPPTPFHRPGAMGDPFVASLGTTWETVNTYFKPYAACRYTHTALRSLRAMMTDGLVHPGAVRSIEVFTPKASMNLTDPAPASLEDAQYSFPFVLATMLLAGDAGGIQLTEAALADPARREAARLVTVHHDPTLDPTYPAHYATRLVVTTTVGQRHEQLRLVAPGDPDDPMSDDDLAAKFVTLLASAGVDSTTAAAAAASLVDPRCPDVHAAARCAAW